MLDALVGSELVDVQYRAGDGAAIAPRRKVGVVRIGVVVIRIHPKIPIQRVFLLLGYHRRSRLARRPRDVRRHGRAGRGDRRCVLRQVEPALGEGRCRATTRSTTRSRCSVADPRAGSVAPTLRHPDSDLRAVRRVRYRYRREPDPAHGRRSTAPPPGTRRRRADTAMSCRRELAGATYSPRGGGPGVAPDQAEPAFPPTRCGSPS